MKAYVMLNTVKGWKVVIDGKHIDATNPIYNSFEVSENGKKKCIEYCNDNGIEIIRVCA